MPDTAAARTGFVKRRVLIVVALTLGAAVVAWVVTTLKEERYEQTLVFVMRPSPQLPEVQIPDAVRALSQDDSQLVRTVSRSLETDLFLRQAAQRAFGRTIADDYSVDASLRPGTDVVELRIGGADRAVVGPLAAAFTVVAPSWVADVYSAYSLQLLDNGRAPRAVSRRVVPTVVLAALAAALIAAAAVSLEAHIRRSSPSRARELGADAETAVVLAPSKPPLTGEESPEREASAQPPRVPTPERAAAGPPPQRL